MEIDLNNRWRVIEAEYEPPQWLLQRLDGGEWRSKSFCQTRKGLMVAVKEKVARANRFYQGGNGMPVDPAALHLVLRLPEKITQKAT